MRDRSRAFTLVELLTVMAVIAILAGLTLSTVGYVQKRAARSRTESEIQALEGALEAYKADNGTYPRDSATDTLNPRTAVTPSNYAAAAKFVYGELAGDRDWDRVTDDGATRYFEFRPEMLSPTNSKSKVNYIVDPFGFCYGYSTVGSLATSGSSATEAGYNPTFDLWSTGGQTSTSGTVRWISNW